MVASKTVISPIFSIIPLKRVQERFGLVEFLRRLELLKLWGLSRQEAGGHALYVQYLYLMSDTYLTNTISVERVQKVSWAQRSVLQKSQIFPNKIIIS